MGNNSRCESLLSRRPQLGRALPLSRPSEEHAALLQDAGEYDLLRRKDDLLDQGVSAVFGIRRGQADLHTLCFDAGRFTAEQARERLRAWGLQPRLFVAASGG